MVCKNCGTQIFESDAFCPYCGTATNNDISSTVAVNAGYYENQTAPNAYADEAAGTEQPAAPLNYYTQPNYPAPQPKKKSAMPIIIGVLSVLLIAAVTALIFKEDIMAAFEKKPAKHNITNQSSSEISKADGSYQFGIDGESTDAASNAAIQEETATAAAVAPTQQPSATQTATQAPTQQPTQAPTQKPATTSAQVSGGGLNSSDISAVVAFYNAAKKKTESGGAPKGNQTMQLCREISADSSMGSFSTVIEPLIENVIDANCGQTNSIPGNGDLLASDVSSAGAESKNGKTTIYIKIKNQTDTLNSSSGPVSRAVGTLGSVDSVLNEFSLSIVSGNDTVKIKYENAYIECVVDEATGRIISGKWHYNATVTIGSATVKISGMTAKMNNLIIIIDNKVEI